MDSQTGARSALVVLGVLAVFAMLKLAEDIFAPMMLALVIGVVLSPLSDGCERLGLPRLICALVTLAFASAVIAGLFLFFEPMVSRVLEQAPVIWAEMRLRLLELQEALQGLDEMSREMAEAISPNAQRGGGGMAIPSLTDALLFAPQLAAQLLVFIGTLFFFVLSRVEAYDWLAHNTRIGGTEPQRAATKLRRAERIVSRYFVTITAINAGFGICVGLAMSAIGLPAPALWGLIAALMNFILYLGPFLVAIMLGAAGIVALPASISLLPAAAFVGLNLIEGQFLTPALVGRHLHVNPLLVFLSLVVWLWLWGPVGGIVAIPLLLWCLVVSRGLEEPAGQTRPSGRGSTSVPSRLAGRDV